MNTEGEDTAPATAGVAPRFGDELLRPFVVAAISVITVIELLERAPLRFAVVIWALTAVVIAVGAASAFPWRRLRDSAQFALVSVFAVGGALLFALAPNTAAVGFVFLASTTAGEKLASRKAVFAVAGIATVVTMVATRIAGSLLHVPGEPVWWLTLAVGLPLYVGVARRERSHALAAAEFAAQQNRRAAASEAREAALEERSRIAREIHDVLGHSLSGIALQLDMADVLLAGGRDTDAGEAVRRARTLAVSGIGETRRAIQALREDTLPLAVTVSRLADGSDAGCTVEGEPGEVRVEVAQAVIRTAQEAITNAHRHAPGAEVNLVLRYEDRLIRLTVTDTGAPAGHRDESGSGMGLVGMRERASLLGGTLHAGPLEPPARGWTVRLELPR
ncbi:two-component sensor histidine kinase [Amycolatopsis rhizosphaerae]|uniref:histidine kinase n=1 Tax=Amycolatopsis rhizosphaerae TaxID=2053003 RepID=A0A558CDP5_9PSEU|nr:histidine kinase [Amycolatopsis rhizosphaerae]TVT46895.1 two-component sensor histidine kinase [Amycolatopsis rhizosphaerae]